MVGQHGCHACWTMCLHSVLAHFRRPCVCVAGRVQPLSVQAAPTAKSGWTTKQKVLAAGGLAVLFAVLVAVVVSYRGHPMTTGEFRGASEWLVDWWR